MTKPEQPNKKDQHRGSVETLALSSHGNELIIAEIDKLIHNHRIGQPYSHNILVRIKYLLERNDI